MNHSCNPVLRRVRADACLLLFALGGCSLAADSVPVIGTVGDLPPLATTVVVQIGEGVEVGGACFGADCNPRTLRDAIDEASRSMGTCQMAVDETNVEVAAANVLVRAHREAPAASFVALLTACASARPPRARIFVEVRHPLNSDAGAIAWFLPSDSAESPRQSFPRQVEVLLPAGTARLDAASLAERLRSIRVQSSREDGVAVWIVVAPSVGMQSLMDAADGVFRAGLVPVVEMPRHGVFDTCGIRVDEGSVEPLSTGIEDDSLTPPRVYQGYAGNTDLRRLPVDLREVMEADVESQPVRDR